MKQVFLGGSSGVRVVDVPAPVPGPGEILVRTAHSLISTGTEGSGVKRAAANAGPALQRIMRDPSLARRAVRKLMREGMSVVTKPAPPGSGAPLAPLGYSASGVVIAVGEAVRRFAPGDVVACAGGGYAVHAEYITVPENLAVPVPDGLDTAAAAFVTLGAVAMQGVRRAEVGLGDRVGVVGLGLLGQIGAQVATAAGGRVIGFDLAADRVALAVELGAREGVISSESDPVDAAMAFSDGNGLDSVILYAGTSSSALINQAFEMCRERGKVVVVGDVGLDVERATFYHREQDLLISRSYGPGRYDSTYEEDGLDYPIAYARWTENRNMDEFVRLSADGRVRLEPLIAAITPVQDAEKAYAQALAASGAAVANLLSYTPAETPVDEQPPLRVVTVNAAAVPGTVRFGVIGAGAFARSFHIPNLMRIEGASISGVAARTGSSATTSARKAGAAYATTEDDRIIGDDRIDAVVISTRHDSHASLAIEAARAGKHVFVEKPLALTTEDCIAVASAVADSGVLLTVGFNRRYSPHAQLVKRALEGARGPKLMTYRVNAGYKAPDHWVYDPIEGGGRIVGEACHFFDLLTYFAGAEPVRVSASALGGLGAEYAAYDNLAITLEFADGSVGQVLYAGNGASDFPKERIEVFCGKRAMAIDDYRTTMVAGTPGVHDLTTKQIDKGHFECLKAFVDAVAGKTKLEMGVVDGVRGTVVALAALEAARTGVPVEIRMPVLSADA